MQVAHKVMKSLYENPVYMKHLKSRNMKQTIMLGFSDGTKDGGYLMANWGIFKAKEALTEISRQYDVKVFDNTHENAKSHKGLESTVPRR